MGKFQKQNNFRKRKDQGKEGRSRRASKIGASKPHDLTSDRITAFGGVLSLVKFLDLVDFKGIFETTFQEPKRKPLSGCYSMLLSLLTLLFIGFSRVWHFSYLSRDPLLCGMFGLEKLLSPSTYWRFLNSMGINQSRSLMDCMTLLRDRVWQLCGFSFKTIHVDIDTTVETIYGDIEGARKGHNTKHRGKKGLRPILAFIEETRECVSGKLRKGTTVSEHDMASFLKDLLSRFPSGVRKVVFRGDGEFISEAACRIVEEAGYEFIWANKRCTPPFPKKGWYRVGRKSIIEYNECHYKPLGWSKKRRFVVMRLPKEKVQEPGTSTQLELFEEDAYTYRIFVANRKGRPHHVIGDYDKRADCENLVGECKREGLAAIPSKKFKNNHVFFQIVLLTFNLWRYLKLFAAKVELEQTTHQTNVKEKQKETPSNSNQIIEHPIVKHTARIARLKMLFIGAKLVTHDNRTQVKYSIHDARVEGFRSFLDGIDHFRKKKKPWEYRNPGEPLPQAA